VRGSERHRRLRPWLASGTTSSATAGFQPFIYATTSGAITTSSGLRIDTARYWPQPGDDDHGRHQHHAATALLNFDIQLGGSDDVFTSADRLPTSSTAARQRHASGQRRAGGTSRGGDGNPRRDERFSNVESSAAVRPPTRSSRRGRQHRQTVNGDLGSDTLDNTATPHIVTDRPGTLDGFQGMAPASAGFDNIILRRHTADLSVVRAAPPAPASTVISYTIAVTNGGRIRHQRLAVDTLRPDDLLLAHLAGGWSCTTPAVMDRYGHLYNLSMAVGRRTYLNVNGPASRVSPTRPRGSATNDPTRQHLHREHERRRLREIPAASPCCCSPSPRLSILGAFVLRE